MGSEQTQSVADAEVSLEDRQAAVIANDGYVWQVIRREIGQHLEPLEHPITYWRGEIDEHIRGKYAVHELAPFTWTAINRGIESSREKARQELREQGA